MVFTYEGDVGRRSREIGVFTNFFSGLAKIFKRSSSSIKRTLESVLAEIESSLMSIDEVMTKLKKRYDELYTLALRAVTEKNIARATIYVNELIEIRNIYKRLTISYNFLEQLKIRLQTLNELDKLMPILLSARNSIEYLKPQIAPIIPGVAVSLDRISSEINVILSASSMPMPIEGTEQFRLVSKEAEELMKRIMQEAEKSVESKLPKLIPELSKLVNKSQQEQESSIELLGVPAPSRLEASLEDSASKELSRSSADSRARSEAPSSTSRLMVSARGVSRIEEIESRLVSYIVSRGGFLDINDFSSRYGYSREEVQVALENLVKKGRIKIVHPSSSPRTVD